jgi:hypothetical protein
MIGGMKMLAYIYAAVMLGLCAAVGWMATDPEFYLPPKRSWSIATEIAFMALYLAGFLFPSQTVEPPAIKPGSPADSN